MTCAPVVPAYAELARRVTLGYQTTIHRALAFGDVVAPIPGTCISKRPETHALGFIHCDGAGCVRTKHPSPRFAYWQ